MIRVVVDTNVLVSGLRNRHGNESRVLDAVQTRVVIPCMSEEIFQEYVDVLARRKFSFLTAEVAKLLVALRSSGEFFAYAPVPFDVSDQSDAKFMACAVAAQADCLVTGNRRHFPDPFYGSARLVNARELLIRIATAP